MKKTLLTLTLALSSVIGFSQTPLVLHKATVAGDEAAQPGCTVLTHSKEEVTVANITYTTGIANPETGAAVGSNPNTTAFVTKIETMENADVITYSLPAGITPGKSLKLEMQYYTLNDGAKDVGSGRYIVRLWNSVTGKSTAGNRWDIFSGNKTGAEWQLITFDGTIEDPGNGNGDDYDRMSITSSFKPITREPFYIDNLNIIVGNTPVLETANDWIYNNLTTDLVATITDLNAVSAASNATPTTSDNDSTVALKITRGTTQTDSGVKLTTNDFDYTDGNLKFRIFPECNENTDSDVKIFVKKDGDASSQIEFPLESLTHNAWNEITIDLSSVTPSPAAAGNLYDEIEFLLNYGDATSDSDGVVFYLDAVQVPMAATASANGIDAQGTEISLFPNPASDTFNITSNNTINNVSVYSLNGQLVKSFTENDSYDISNLATGLYSVRVTTATGSKTIKLIKK